MNALYNYGISQEDILSEYKALEIAENDSLICIASGGEIPLNMAALQELKILAVDTSINQLRLCRIKQLATSVMDSIKAASFLGYMDMTDIQRLNIYKNEIRILLSNDDRTFWDRNSSAIQKGLINAGRFEKYIRKFSYLGRAIIGIRNFYRLFECDTVEDQKYIFDEKISGPLLKNLFRIAFHPRIYRNRGIDQAGLMHSGSHNIADLFFQRFKNFCCNTLSRKNYFLQYIFFNRVLFPEALPAFLQPSFHHKFVKNQNNIGYQCISIKEALLQADPGQYNKIHLSNIGDWISKEEMTQHFNLIKDKTIPSSRVILRYIHMNHKVPASISELSADYNLGENLVITDRFPFYAIVPIYRK